MVRWRSGAWIGGICSLSGPFDFALCASFRMTALIQVRIAAFTCGCGGGFGFGWEGAEQGLEAV
jgi:hypothetical protein